MHTCVSWVGLGRVASVQHVTRALQRRRLLPHGSADGRIELGARMITPCSQRLRHATHAHEPKVTSLGPRHKYIPARPSQTRTTCRKPAHACHCREHAGPQTLSTRTRWHEKPCGRSDATALAHTRRHHAVRAMLADIPHINLAKKMGTKNYVCVSRGYFDKSYRWGKQKSKARTRRHLEARRPLP